MKNYMFIFFSFLFVRMAFGQTAEVDSLKNRLPNLSPAEKARVYNRLAQLDTKNNPDKRIGYGQQALKAAGEAGDREQIYRAYSQIATGYAYRGNNTKALEYDLKASEIVLTLHKPALSAENALNLAYDYYYLGNYDKALENNLKALEIRKTLYQPGDRKTALKLAQSYNNTGGNFSVLHQYRKALGFHREALSLRKQYHDSAGIAQSLHNLGSQYEHLGKLDSALVRYKQALVIRRKLGNRKHLIETLNNLGIVWKRKGQYTRALQYYREAYNLIKSSGYPKYLPEIANNIADVYLRKQMPDKALPYIKEAEQSARKSRHIRRLAEIDENLVRYYVAKNDYRNAYRYQTERLALKDSLFHKDLAEKISNLEYRFALREKENRLKIQDLRLKRRKNWNYALMGLSAVFLLLLLVSYLLLNRRKWKQRHTESQLEKARLAEERLKEKNAYQSRQLTAHALHMLQKNKLLAELDREIQGYLHTADAEQRKRIGNIRRRIKRNMNLEKDWELFRLFFEEVNKDFFNILKSHCPSLSVKDLRLAALIKLNLSIKEAASVLNISPDSVKKARYRLRRKLGLQAGEKLSDFLSTL